MPAVLAAHTHPDSWPEALLWKPSRWISSPSNSPSLSVKLEEEIIVTPAKGTYIPFSDGPQNCLGEKFAKVEVVAVLACLLKIHRVGIVTNVGESSESAKKRALRCVEDCDWELLLRMRNPDQVKLAWRKLEF
jgi:cytochrome P450